MADKIRIEFAAIDAKDDCYTGYHTVGFVLGERPLPPFRETVRVQSLMEREYLTRLYTLQEEIAEKYLKIFQPIAEDVEATEEDYEAFRREAKALFPGRCASYYT